MQALREWNFTDALLLQLAINICQRVTEMHEQNVIHNDLKENNIMVNERLEVFLIDFGNATFPGEVIGYSTNDAEWLAPELSGWQPTSVNSDAYTVGYLLQLIASHMFNG